MAALTPITGVAMSAVEVALCCEAAEAGSVRVIGQEPEFAYLAGEQIALPPHRMIRAVPSAVTPRLPMKRHAQVTAWWTPWHRVPISMMRPQAVVIAENQLLIAIAKSTDSCIAFRHRGIYLAAARRARAAVSGIDVNGLSHLIVNRLLGSISLTDPFRSRLERLLLANCGALLPCIAADLAGMRHIALPAEVWAGSAGDYASRLVGLEVMRRGGTVVRHEHGGTIGMIDHPEVVASLELAAASRYVLPTDKLARNVRTSGAAELLTTNQPIEIVGHSGNPAIDRLPLKGRQVGPRRRVVYCPPPLLGFQRHTFAVLPDPVSLDWTFRVAETLVALPIELLFKPHPEGVFQGREHPVSRLGPTSYRPFEEEMANTDVFVFDRCHCMAFWEAICTDRPVVYLAATPPPFHPAVRELIAQRCHVLEATFDERNLPQIDSRALREAVLDAPARIDSSAIRDLLAGAPE